MDIGDRKGAEVELRGREERFRLVAEATQDAVWDWDLLTDRITWDELGTMAAFGYPRHTTPGRHRRRGGTSGFTPMTASGS